MGGAVRVRWVPLDGPPAAAEAEPEPELTCALGAVQLHHLTCGGRTQHVTHTPVTEVRPRPPALLTALRASVPGKQAGLDVLEAAANLQAGQQLRGERRLALAFARAPAPTAARRCQ